jgi:hypothetical protein
MFDSQVRDETNRDRTATPAPGLAGSPERPPAPMPAVLPEISIRLRTDGRHFFFAPSVWSA